MRPAQHRLLSVPDRRHSDRITGEGAGQRLGQLPSPDQHFQPFLSALTEQLEKGQDSIAAELRALAQGIDRIRDLVNSQQDYVTRVEVVESCDLATLIDKALKVSGDVDRFHQGIEVVREFQPLPKVPIDRYKTLEILVNLIQNARHAMEEQGGAEHRLTLRLEAQNDGPTEDTQPDDAVVRHVNPP